MLELRGLDDLAHESVRVEEHIIIKNDVVYPDNPLLAQIHVVSQQAYEDFLKKGDRMDGEPLDAYGARLYKKNACYTCHTTDGSKGNGPTWKGIYGRSETMASGETLTIDDNYIKESILKPQAKIVNGFTNVQMPPFTLNDEQISALIAYMKTLK